MPKVQIIIPSINCWKKYTKPCIESIKTSYPYRILLIDNASTDETEIEAGKMVSDTFSHHRNSTIWGCSESWNYGIRDAFDRGYDYILVLNNDVILNPEAIDKLIERFENKDLPEIVIATCMDITSECEVPNSIYLKDSKDKKDVSESEHPCFSGFMINKKCWDKVGEFDENFKPAYFEDNDYHYRINLAELKAIVLPTSLFYHYGSVTRRESGVEIVTNQTFEKNRHYYYEKWGGLPGQEGFKTPFNS